VKKNPEPKGARKRRESTGKQRPEKITDRIVLVIDDDISALNGLVRLIRSAGFAASGFGHPGELLNAQLPARNVCLVADIYLPEMNGVELSHALALAGRRIPTILITGRNDDMTRRLVENSEAVALLYKPIDEVPLLEAISRCLKM
jgi:FixJ family two-component response regulator